MHLLSLKRLQRRFVVKSLPGHPRLPCRCACKGCTKNCHRHPHRHSRRQRHSRWTRKRAQTQTSSGYPRKGFPPNRMITPIVSITISLKDYKATLPSLSFFSQSLIIALPSSLPSARAKGTETAFPICLNCCKGKDIAQT